jgi:DNA-binding beta-propeller fold protein YncE
MHQFSQLVVAGLISCAIGAAAVSCSRETPAEAQEGSGAAEVLERADVIDRLIERTAPHVPESGAAPSFVVDPGWPKPLPNNWRLGQIGGLYVDRHDNIWVYHRPRSLNSNEAGALGVAGKDAKGQPVSALGHPRPYGQYSGCCIPAPSVLQFDKAGNLLQAWGGPADPGFLEKKCREADGCFWPAREHGIFVDHNDFVYISGNGQDFKGQFPWAAKFGDDSHVLKFTKDGTFVYQIGHAGRPGPDSDDIGSGPNGTPQPYLPADMTVDPKTNLLYIADGYGNRRVLIVDAATGKYVGHFGAYGQNPVDGEGDVTPNVGYDSGPWMADFQKGNMKPKFFRSPLHCAKLSGDGLLYACDRGNNRVQVFRASEVGKPCSNPEGEVGKCGFVGEVPVAPQTAAGTSGAVNFSTDPAQSCMYVADLSNNTIYIVNRSNLQELDRVGRGGRQIGEFHWVHVVSVDSEGNLYTGEVDTAMRVQKFLRYGPAASCSGTGMQEVGKYR